jgi:hypothetical protein
MVSVLAIGFKVSGFKLGQGDGFLRAIKIRTTPSFGGKVKPEAPCGEIIRYIKKSLISMKQILRKARFIIPFASSSCLIPDDSADRISRDLWWTIQELFSVDIIPPWF